VTVLVALVDNGVGYLAADSRISFNDLYVDGAKKIHRLGKALVGFCGDTAFEGALNGFRPLTARTSVDAWCRELAADVRRQAVADGHGCAEADGVSYIDAAMLVVTNSSITYINGAGAVDAIPAHGFSIGSGGAVALGALTVMTDNGGTDIRRCLEVAVDVAKRHISSCGGTTVVETVTK